MDVNSEQTEKRPNFDPKPEITQSSPSNREGELRNFLFGAGMRLLEEGDTYHAISALVAIDKPQDIIKRSMELREMKNTVGNNIIELGNFASAATRVIQGKMEGEPIEGYDPQVANILDISPEHYKHYQEELSKLDQELEQAQKNGAETVKSLSSGSLTKVTIGSFELPLATAADSTPTLLKEIKNAWEKSAKPEPLKPTPGAPIENPIAGV